MVCFEKEEDAKKLRSVRSLSVKGVTVTVVSNTVLLVFLFLSLVNTHKLCLFYRHILNNQMNLKVEISIRLFCRRQILTNRRNLRCKIFFTLTSFEQQ